MKEILMAVIVLAFVALGCGAEDKSKSKEDYLWEAVSLYDSSSLYFNLSRYARSDSEARLFRSIAYKYQAAAKYKEDSSKIFNIHNP